MWALLFEYQRMIIGELKNILALVSVSFDWRYFYEKGCNKFMLKDLMVTKKIKEYKHTKIIWEKELISLLRAVY